MQNEPHERLLMLLGEVPHERHLPERLRCVTARAVSKGPEILAARAASSMHVPSRRSWRSTPPCPPVGLVAPRGMPGSPFISGPGVPRGWRLWGGRRRGTR